jgi:hypothetical protein
MLFSLLFLAFSGAQEGVTTVNQDPEIDKLIALKKEINKSEIFFKIQIYSGNRSGAEKIRKEFREAFTEFSDDIKYETPNYKIWIGNFRTRLEADRALVKVKKKFENAFVFKPKKQKKTPNP